MRLFLYGTLMHGTCNDLASALHAKVCLRAEAQVRGWLHACPDPGGWYPALVPDEGGDPVRGVLAETLATFTEADLAALDAYEGADYVRQEIPVEDGGLIFMAHAWAWHGALPEGAELIPDGDFFGYASRHGLPVFRPE